MMTTVIHWIIIGILQWIVICQTFDIIVESLCILLLFKWNAEFVYKCYCCRDKLISEMAITTLPRKSTKSN